MSRCLAEMMPTVTEPPSPNGLPIAITQSPTLSLSGRAEGHRGQRLLRRHLQQREIGLGVLADDLVDLELGAVVEVDDDLVGAVDDVIVGDDEAFLAVDDEAGAERGPLRSDGDLPPLRLKKSSKNSSNGAPFGTFGNGAPSGPFTVWLVEMLTTASISFSANGATLVGPCAAFVAWLPVPAAA